MILHLETNHVPRHLFKQEQGEQNNLSRLSGQKGKVSIFTGEEHGNDFSDGGGSGRPGQ